MRDTVTNLVGVIALSLIIISLYLVFVYAPTEANMGHVQRIFYYHVSFAWTSFLAFFVTFVASILYLIKKSRFWDIVALSSVELGVAFCMIILITGPIWAKPVWGAYWTWDPRLVTTLILLFIFSAYLILRGAIDEETKRGRYAAVIGIIGFFDIPIVYMSIQWWSRTIHPDVVRPEKIDLPPEMVQTLFTSFAAITTFFVFMLLRRIRLEELRDEVVELRKKILKEN